MTWLIACEESGVVRDAFLARGINAVSCDLLPSARPGPHLQRDVRLLDLTMYTGMIAFPPCTDLASSGARWFEEKRADGRQQRAVEFVRFLADAPIDRIAIENPIGVLSSQWRKPDQIVQPWQFGHGETKATCLWLAGLPKLLHTDIVDGREPRIHRMAPGPNRARDRSRTYQGIADAMARQWAGAAVSPIDFAKLPLPRDNRLWACPVKECDAEHMMWQGTRAHLAEPYEPMSREFREAHRREYLFRGDSESDYADCLVSE